MTFIVGMGRSGTTMLTNMLNNNPKVISCPENEFIMYSYHYFKNENFKNENVINNFIKLFDKKFSKTISFWKPESDLKNSIINLNKKTYENVCKQVYLNYPFANKKKGNVSHIVDKNPIYSLYLKQLNSIFPKSKYIILARDYRDNVLSRKKHAENTNSIYTLAESWNYYYENIFKNVIKYNLDYYVLRYEDLVNNPSETLTSLCKFLEIEFDEKMLHFQDLANEIKQYIEKNLPEKEFSKLKTMHHNLENKITENRVNAYQKELTKEDITILDSICSETGAKFNYLPNSKFIKKSLKVIVRKNLSKLKILIYYNLHAFFLRVPISMRIIFK